MQLAMYSKQATNTTIIISRSVPTSLDLLVHLITIAVVVGLAVGLVLAVLSHPASLAQTLAPLLNSVISTHLSFPPSICLFSHLIFFTSASASSSSLTTLRSAHDLTFQSALSSKILNIKLTHPK